MTANLINAATAQRSPEAFTFASWQDPSELLAKLGPGSAAVLSGVGKMILWANGFEYPNFPIAPPDSILWTAWHLCDAAKDLSLAEAAGREYERIEAIVRIHNALIRLRQFLAGGTSQNRAVKTRTIKSCPKKKKLRQPKNPDIKKLIDFASSHPELTGVTVPQMVRKCFEGKHLSKLKIESLSRQARRWLPERNKEALDVSDTSDKDN